MADWTPISEAELAEMEVRQHRMYAGIYVPRLVVEIRRTREALREAREDVKRLDWLEWALADNQYHSDLAIQWDEEDGVWFAKVYRFDHGEIRGEPFEDADSKNETVRAAIDAARVEPEAEPRG